MNNKPNKTTFKKGHPNFTKKGKRPNFHGNSSSFKKGMIPYNKAGRFIDCLVCGKKTWVEPKQEGRKKFCSKQCLYKSGVQTKTFQKGDKHPAWVNGESRNNYPPEFNYRLKLKIRTRDSFICCLCGRTEEQELEELNRVLAVNHIDFNKNNCSENNLNTLCLRCNTMINWDREKWTNHFINLMNKSCGK